MRGIKSVLSITLVILIYLTSFKINALNLDFHELEFEKVGTYDRVEEADVIHKQTMSFLTGDSFILPEDYSLREKKHLEDVRTLIELIDTIYWITGIVFISLLLVMGQTEKKFLSPFTKVLLRAGIITLVIGGFILVSVILNFDWFFRTMHNFLFEAGTWVFPKESLLIQLYPAQFFFDAARYTFSAATTYGFILILPRVTWKIVKATKYLKNKKQKKKR